MSFVNGENANFNLKRNGYNFKKGNSLKRFSPSGKGSTVKGKHFGSKFFLFREDPSSEEDLCAGKANRKSQK